MRSLPLAAALCLSVFAGCASSRTSDVVSAATDLPERFLVGSLSSDARTEPRPGEGCRSPMVDPRDGARLTLDRSANGLGDYTVPAGRYGVQRGERLRLDCATGRPIGRVRG